MPVPEPEHEPIKVRIVPDDLAAFGAALDKAAKSTKAFDIQLRRTGTVPQRIWRWFVRPRFSWLVVLVCAAVTVLLRAWGF